MNEIIFRYLHGLAVGSAWFQPLVIFASVYLGWVMMGLILFIFARRAREKPAVLSEFWFAVGTATGAWLIAQVIKWLSPAARPFVALSDIVPLIKVSDSSAFPSGHAAFFFALGIAVYSLDRRLGQWLIAGAALISAARVMAGVHWPSDILAGLVLALVVSQLVLFFVRLFQSGFARRAS